MSILVYYGFCHESESTLALKVGCDPEWGTDPHKIITLLESFGLRTVARTMTLEWLETFTEKGIPVMILYQAWSESDEPWDDCWDDGHYSIVIGLDDENVYIEDPSLAGEIGFIPRPEFLTRWHDVDRKGNQLTRFGIAVMGPAPKQEFQYRQID